MAEKTPRQLLLEKRDAYEKPRATLNLNIYTGDLFIEHTKFLDEK